jgi:hypothetical protein
VTDCAGTNTIAALLAGAIDSAAADRLEHHLDTCATCRRLVADLGRGLSAIGERGATGSLPKIGERVGRFTIERLIGVGGMGVVFEAHDPTLDRTVALKLLRPDIVAGDLLLDEAQAMARLQHPNIVVVHDVGRTGGQLYVCMEYVAGSTLRAWLAASDHTWREIAEMFLAAARGLAYVHAAGLVHRDFKPDNVLIGGDRVVVTDFGLARVVDKRVGTPAYMAPEQTRGDRVDARADQYAFCVALREAVGDRAPGWLRRLVARGAAERPIDRFASMDELVAAIDTRLHAPPRALVRTVAVAAALVVVAFAIPRAKEIVTRVIDRPMISRVEARPAPALETRGATAVAAPSEAAPTLRRDPLAPVFAAPTATTAWLPAATTTRPQLTDVTVPADAPLPHVSPASFELPGGFTPVATCDDGGERRCALAEPACPPTTMAAMQGGCWTCADDRSCAPLGLPHSCDDGSKLACAMKPPACPGHDVPSIHAGCWRCEDPFACRLGGGGGGGGGGPQHHEPRCGNLVCESGEDPMTCPTDCHGTGSNGGNGSGNGSGSGSGSASCNHNGMCEAGENHDSCPADCCVVQADGSCAPVCGNGFCETGETPTSCPQDC